MPITGSFKESSPIIRAKNWSDVSATVAHIAVKTYKRAMIDVHSRDSLGRPKSGDLIFELDPNRLGMYRRYVEYLEKGGFASILPNVNLNKAYIGSKFAVFVEPDAYQPKEVHPDLRAMINHEKTKKRETTDSRCRFVKPAVQKLSREVRLMKLRSDLDELMESDG